MQLTRPNFSLGSQGELCFAPEPSRVCKILETRIKRADLFSLPISTPFSAPVNNAAARSATKHVHPALYLNRCLQRGLFSVDTSRLIAFLAAFPPANDHLSAGSARQLLQPGHGVREPSCPEGCTGLGLRAYHRCRTPRAGQAPRGRKQPAAAPASGRL